MADDGWRCASCGCAFPDHPADPVFMEGVERCSVCVKLEIAQSEIRAHRKLWRAIDGALRQSAFAHEACDEVAEALDVHGVRQVHPCHRELADLFRHLRQWGEGSKWR